MDYEEKRSVMGIVSEQTHPRIKRHKGIPLCTGESWTLDIAQQSLMHSVISLWPWTDWPTLLIKPVRICWCHEDWYRTPRIRRCGHYHVVSPLRLSDVARLHPACFSALCSTHIPDVYLIVVCQWRLYVLIPNQRHMSPSRITSLFEIISLNLRKSIQDILCMSWAWQWNVNPRFRKVLNKH